MAICNKEYDFQPQKFDSQQGWELQGALNNVMM
jgi:hypothetical protein